MRVSNIIVHTMGSNGSGKSTSLKELWEVSNIKEEILDEQGRGVNSTYLKDLDIVVLGKYHNECGGCDGITGHGGLQRVSEAIEQILRDETLYGKPILFEGLLTASLVNIRRIQEMIEKYNYRYLVVHADPELSTCLARIQQRNGGKPINENSVESRWSCERKHTTPNIIKDGKPDIRVWHNDNTPRGEMLNEFLSIVDEWITTL